MPRLLVLTIFFLIAACVDEKEPRLSGTWNLGYQDQFFVRFDVDENALEIMELGIQEQLRTDFTAQLSGRDILITGTDYQLELVGCKVIDGGCDLNRTCVLEVDEVNFSVSGQEVKTLYGLTGGRAF
ncbi:MAG TPA: hypothetical protein VD927_07655 [Chryseosolibacter sp.]|nr:hypothetical protein [Chryseosolibacter sp.]